MLYGEHEHNLDEKGRVTIPAAFRDDLKSGVFVTRGPDGCLLAFEAETWAAISPRLRKHSISSHTARLLFSGSLTQMDGNSRILLPAGLRAYARLEVSGPVVVLGVGDRLELWNRDVWTNLNSNLLTSGEYKAGLRELDL